MTLRGIGIDVASIERFYALVERHDDHDWLVRRWFSRDAICATTAPELAVQLTTRFAAKEAVWKALGLNPDRPVPWREIVVRPSRAPGLLVVQLDGRLDLEAQSCGVTKISVTHTRFGDLIVAVALAEATATARTLLNKTPF